MSEETLKSHRPGDEVEVIGVRETRDPLIARRLMALGFVPGTKVKVLRRAPLGDPVEYALRGTRISLRGSESACIEVRSCL